jgi:hypothetical protein
MKINLRTKLDGWQQQRSALTSQKFGYDLGLAPEKPVQH